MTCKCLRIHLFGRGAGEGGYILDILRPVNREGSRQGETKCTATTSQILIHCSGHVPLVRMGEASGKMKLNGSGRRKLDR